MNTTAHEFAFISSTTCCSTFTLFASSLEGRVEHLKTIRIKAICFCSAVASELLNLVLQSAVVIFGSLRPGVSIRMKSSNSISLGSCVTPSYDRFARNLATSAALRQFINVDFPVPKVPKHMTLGFRGTDSTICTVRS